MPYKEKLDVIMGGQPFFLSMPDTPAYHAGARDAMRKAVRPEDVGARLAPACAAMAEQILAEGHGRLEVVEPSFAGLRSTCSAIISACPSRPMATFASGARGCSSFSSPMAATIRRCAPR